MILAGDFIPKDLNVCLPREFGGKVLLANLEGPICADGLPKSNKVGVCLHTSRESLDFSIVSSKDDAGMPSLAFSIANNHIMDFCEEGLRQTTEFLVSRSIQFAGAGIDEAQARRPMILEEGGSRIAVFCCCERQFGMASEDVPGCAAKGEWLYRAIRDIKTKGQVDFVVISCHAANEFCPWPSPDLRDFYHSLIDAGADCIHGHHAHVPQGYEAYHGKPIFYGLGNFAVDTESWKSNQNHLWSLVAEISFIPSGVSWKVKPYCVLREGDTLRISVADGDLLRQCQDYEKSSCAPFASKELLEGCWQEAVCRLYYRLYERNLRIPACVTHAIPWRDRLRTLYLSIGDLCRVITGRAIATDRSRFRGKVVFNAFNCESHVSSIQTAMGILLGVVPDKRTAETAKMADEMGVR